MGPWLARLFRLGCENGGACRRFAHLGRVFDPVHQETVSRRRCLECDTLYQWVPPLSNWDDQAPGYWGTVGEGLAA